MAKARELVSATVPIGPIRDEMPDDETLKVLVPKAMGDEVK